MRYIEIDSIIEQIKAEHCERCTNHRCTLCDIDEVLILLEEADDADVEEVKHGEWIEYPSDAYMKCYVCGIEYLKSGMPRIVGYCPNPNCGAKMDGERKEK